MHTYRLSITEDLNQIPASTTPYNSVAAGTAGTDFGSGPYVDRRAPYQNWEELYSTFNHGVAGAEGSGARRLMSDTGISTTPKRSPGTSWMTMRR